MLKNLGIKPESPVDAFYKRLGGLTAVLPPRSRACRRAGAIIRHEAVLRKRKRVLNFEAEYGHLSPVTHETSEGKSYFVYVPMFRMKPLTAEELQAKIAKIFSRPSHRPAWWRDITKYLDEHDLH